MVSTFIIAEAGVNHNGDLQKAIDLINIASEIGADAVKFQTFNSSNLVTISAPKANYQKRSNEEEEFQIDMLRKLELSKKDHYELLKHTKEKEIKFLSSAFDSESLNFLVEDMKVSSLKIASGEITNGPFLLEHARTGLEIILSTGMSNLHEIEQALSVLAFGYLKNKEIPSKKNILNAYSSKRGKEILKKKVTLLHCTSQYPAEISEINLNAIKTMKDHFGLKIGYSDHTRGRLASCNAVTLGAEVIEKHFTQDRGLPGPDHKASLDPREMKEFIKSIRNTEKSLGNGIKEASKSEIENLSISRKSIVAKKDINKGDLFSYKNITQKRPGTGKNPMEFWDLIDTPSTRSYKTDDLIEE
jgi:N-acetylneuraminate synthase